MTYQYLLMASPVVAGIILTIIVHRMVDHKH